MTLQERHEKARALHQQGYNCAQCVALAFTDVTGLDETTTARVAAGLGGGVGATGEICGALTGATIAEGLVYFKTPADKPAINAKVKDVCGEFAALNGGMVRCRDLKGKDKKPCMTLIEEAITLLHNRL